VLYRWLHQRKEGAKSPAKDSLYSAEREDRYE